jgi:hypothetical protein
MLSLQWGYFSSLQTIQVAYFAVNLWPGSGQQADRPAPG